MTYTGDLVEDTLEVTIKENLVDPASTTKKEIGAVFTGSEDNTLLAVKSVSPANTSISNRYMIGRGKGSLQQALKRANAIESASITIDGSPAWDI